MSSTSTSNTGPQPAEVEKPGVTTRSARRALQDVTNASSSSSSAVACEATQQQQQVTETRAYMLRAADDIDERDRKNVLLCADYVGPMYNNFRDVEAQFMVDSNYMEERQPHVNERMRAILIDWLVEVHQKFKLVPETLYLTVAIIDRYLEQAQVRRSKLQLVGVTALLIASKYEDIYPPELRDLVYITDRAYNKQEILEMESLICNTLDFQFTVPTVHSFLCRYLKAAHADRRMVQLACYITERMLQEYEMIKFLPSTIAASAILLARKSLQRHPWSPTLLRYTNYDEDDLAPCLQQVHMIMNSSASLQAVKRKYQSSRFGGVANLTLASP